MSKGKLLKRREETDSERRGKRNEVNNVKRRDGKMT